MTTPTPEHERRDPANQVLAVLNLIQNLAAALLAAFGHRSTDR
jgi:hypothetical protein